MLSSERRLRALNWYHFGVWAKIPDLGMKWRSLPMGKRAKKLRNAASSSQEKLANLSV